MTSCIGGDSIALVALFALNFEYEHDMHIHLMSNVSWTAWVAVLVTVVWHHDGYGYGYDSYHFPCADPLVHEYKSARVPTFKLMPITGTLHLNDW
jgi:hypothetical protein